jgi:hypothetical protein
MTTPKKRGRPLRFPARVLVYVTDDTRAQLDALAARQGRAVPDIVRAYISAGLEGDRADDTTV